MTSSSPVMDRTLPVLDEDTERELQPPCEVDRRRGRPCSRAAEWIVTYSPCTHGANHILVCEQHKIVTVALNRDIKVRPGWACGATPDPWTDCIVTLLSVVAL